MNAKTKAAVIGSSNIDLVTNVVRMPRVGETLEGTAFNMNFGGKGANQAVALARLGTEVFMVTRVGDDMFGKSTLENFKTVGLNTKHAKILSDTPTGVATILVDGDANNNIVIVKGANGKLMPEDVDRAAEDLKQCGMIILQLEIPIETVYRAIDWGYENGVPVLLNPAPAAQLDPEHVHRVEFFVPNETELELITGLPVKDVKTAREAARSLVIKGVKNVIVTLGANGSLLVNPEREELFPTCPIHAIDTTGAGDAFIGSFVHYYLETGDIALAMTTANRYAALSTTRAGAQKSYATLEEFEVWNKA